MVSEIICKIKMKLEGEKALKRGRREVVYEGTNHTTVSFRTCQQFTAKEHQINNPVKSEPTSQSEGRRSEPGLKNLFGELPFYVS